MIFFTDRSYKTVAVADSQTSQGLKLLEDELNQAIKTGTAIYTAKLAKNDETVAKIKAGDFVFVPNFKGQIIALEVMEVEETHSYKKIIAEDAGLQLINSDAGPIKMKGTLKEHVIACIGSNSDWEIGVNEIGDKHNITLEYTSSATQTKRLVQIAGRFGAEISYSFEFRSNQVVHKRINFYKKRGKNIGVRLEVGKELKDVRRNVSTTNLRTAVRGIGQKHKEKIKTTKEVTHEVEVPTEESSGHVDNGKLDPFIDWFKSREGQVSYSMACRYGPDSYDCSSAVCYAAKEAGLLPDDFPIGSTETLFSINGQYLDEIGREDIRYGDIFISGVQGASGGAGGHTGAVLSSDEVIHCNYSSNGIARTPIDGYVGGPPTRWFRWKNSGRTEEEAPKKYWTDDDIRQHDLGWKLKGLSADQLDNWVRATSPDSPFNGQGNVFLEAQNQSSLDARYILAHAALESAWGKSNIARNYNNYFGIGAFDSNPDNASNYSNAGLAAGIIEGAKWIAENYYNNGQKTLHDMRWNNGVHQYATDPDWDTKIASIMKQSERFTDASSGGGTEVQEVTETVEEEKEIEKDTNLIGYVYDDGRFFVNTETGALCDRQANEIWAKPYSGGKYLERVYQSQATSQEALFNECMKQLKENNHPEVSYEVSPEDIPTSVDIGDMVRIIDHQYTPSLYLEARLIDVTTSTTHHRISKAIFANYEERSSGILPYLLDLQKEVQSQKYKWDNQPYQMVVTSSSGNLFKKGLLNTTLLASVTRGGIDVSATMSGFIWERVSRYPKKLGQSDADWNQKHNGQTDHFLNVENSDVEIEATFTCSAMLRGTAVAVATYTIKNLYIGVYNQEEEPKVASWGDIWQFDGGEGKRWKREYQGNGKWVDTVTQRDLAKIQAMPGPPGAPGKDGERGLPGKDGRDGQDGKSSYIHFAYADSEDGRVGFTLTATPNKPYMGVYADSKTSDSSDPSAYQWSKVKGEDGPQGIPGKAGEDGRTPYIHQAWANSEDGREGFSTSQSEGKTYMGTCVDYSQNDPTNPDSYQWQYIFKKEMLDSKAELDYVKNVEKKAIDANEMLKKLPPIEALKDLTGNFADTNAYVKHLETAVKSDKADAEERFKVIEKNVGSGQDFMKAVSRYLSFSEEGLVLGQEGSALKVAIDNDKISFLDSGKEVAYVSGQMLYILSGVFLNSLSIGNHKVEKLAGSKETTTISWIGGDS